MTKIKKEIRYDDPGNIAFGYYGAALYSKEFLHFGAGANQFKKYIDSDGKHPIGPLNKFYDDPRDYAMIDWGYDLYWEEN